MVFLIKQSPHENMTNIMCKHPTGMLYINNVNLILLISLHTRRFLIDDFCSNADDNLALTFNTIRHTRWSIVSPISIDKSTLMTPLTQLELLKG